MLEVITAPTVPAVPLGEMKRHLGVTSSERDTDIESMVDGATRWLVKRTKRAYAVTTYRLNLSECHVPVGDFQPICLPRPPIQSITTVEYDPGTGAFTAITGYQLVRSEEYAYILPAASTRWPAVALERFDAFRVTYVAGSTAVPAEAKHCIKLIVRHWYDNGSATMDTTNKEIELGVKSLCRSLGTGFYANVSAYETSSDY